MKKEFLILDKIEKSLEIELRGYNSKQLQIDEPDGNYFMLNGKRIALSEYGDKAMEDKE
jgi:hypothetical protein